MAGDSGDETIKEQQDRLDGAGKQQAARQPTYPLSLALWNFSSQWFLVPQGTGVISVSLYRLNYQFPGLSIIAIVVWVYTMALLVISLFLYLLRIILYPQHVAHVLKTNIVETSCLASISITCTTIIQMIAFVLIPDWGQAWGIVAYVLWWINTAMAVTAVMVIPYVFVKIQPPGVKAIAPGVLLPLISALTSAAGGGTICTQANLTARLQVPVIIIAYLEVGLGLPLAITLGNIFMTRLFDRSFPRLEQVYQDMILCGPFGQGAFALLILGQAVEQGSFAAYDSGRFLTAQAAGPVSFASQFAGLLSWGYGTFWWCFATISIIHTMLLQPNGMRNSHFTMSAWSLIFPWVSLPFLSLPFSCSPNSPMFMS